MQEVQVPARPGTASPRFRWVMIGAVSLAMIVGFFDRTAIPILIVDQAFLDTFGIADNPAAQGFIVTGFLLTYGFGNIVLGPFADVLGARRATLLMFVAGAVTSLFAAATSMFALFTGARMVRGFVDAPQFPLMNRFVKNWFPASERGAANATWLTALAVSSAIALPLFTFLVAALGWRATIVAISLSILVVAVPLVWFFATDKPEQSRFVSAEELDRIGATGRPDARAAQETSSFRSGALVFLRNPDYYMLNLFHLSTMAIYWGLLTWMPKYLAEARGFSLGEMGAVTGASFGAAAVATFAMGFIADRLPWRAPLCFVMMLLAAVAIFGAAVAESGAWSGVFLAVGLAARAVASPNLFAILQRIVPANVISAGAGLDNGIANLGSAITPALIGFLIGVTGSYAAGLYFLMGAALLAAFAMGILSLRRY